MSLRKAGALASAGAFGAWLVYLHFFDKDTKMLVNEINAERARRVHSNLADQMWDNNKTNGRNYPTYRLPFLDR